MTVLDRALRITARVALLVMAVLVTHYTTEGTWRLTHQNVEGGWSGAYHWKAAEALLVHARLDVDPIHILGECFERDGRCYGYFGLTPTLLRVPVLGFNRFFHSALTPVFLGAAILLAYWAALQMLQRGLRTAATPQSPPAMTLGYAILVSVALGPASTLVFLARPGVFEEAMAWAVAFILLTFNHVWRWIDGETRRLWPALLFATAAANARPTAALAAGVLGLGLAAWCLRRSRGWRFTAQALCLAMLPAVTAAGVFWAKLGTPLPSVRMSKQVQEAPHWRDILARNGNRVGGLVFLPTALLTYFRPDTVTTSERWPYFDFRIRQESIAWVPPLVRDGAYVERTASLTTTMPLPWLLNIVAVAWMVSAWWRARTLAVAGLAAGFVASAAAMTVLVLTTVGITTRYLGDFYPLSAVGAAFAPMAVLPSRAEPAWRALLPGSVALLLVIWGVIVTLSLSTRLVFD